MNLGPVLSALTALALPVQPVSGARPDDAALVASAHRVIDSTTAEWTVVFATDGRRYVPPRAIFLRTPLGHPSRGAGYHATMGLGVDLGDLQGIQDVFGADATTLSALMLAHEVGHHVQALDRAAGDPRALTPSGLSREQQADCYAGFWLTRANARRESAGEPAYNMPSLERRLPELLRVLSIFSRKRLFAQSDTSLHGSASARVAAIQRGLAAATPASCAEF